jgi:hypothetical protein
VIIDKLEDLFRQRAEPKPGPKNVFRASSAGYCERRLGYDKLGIPGDPITPRRAAVFHHGNILDRALKTDMAQALGDKFLDLGKLPRNYCEIEGVDIGFEPDGAFQTDDGQIGIIEIKTMAEFGFNRALKGEIERSYLCQSWVYSYGTSFNPIVFVCYKKNTSHFCEVIFDRRATETVVTQRFGGDPVELEANGPLLIAEIRTPFDPSVEEEVRGKFSRLAKVEKEKDLSFGVKVYENETVSVQGKEKAAPLIAQYGEPVKSGSWYKFETGRKIAGFPCSYCPHIRRCLGARLEFKDNKPVWVLKSAAPAESEDAA